MKVHIYKDGLVKFPAEFLACECVLIECRPGGLIRLEFIRKTNYIQYGFRLVPVPASPEAKYPVASCRKLLLALGLPGERVAGVYNLTPESENNFSFRVNIEP